MEKQKDILGCKFIIVNKKQADIIFPKEMVKVKQKFLHNRFLCILGAILFPKGSKIRALLKKMF